MYVLVLVSLRPFRFGLECAVLTALASALGTTLAGLLAAEPGQAPREGTVRLAGRGRCTC